MDVDEVWTISGFESIIFVLNLPRPKNLCIFEKMWQLVKLWIFPIPKIVHLLSTSSVTR